MGNHISGESLIKNNFTAKKSGFQRVWIGAGWLLLAFLVGLIGMPPASADTVRVGILAPRGEAHARDLWAPTLEALNERLAPARFVARPLELEALETAVAAAEVDFVITNPGQFVFLSIPYQLSWLATLSADSGSSREVLGSVLLVRADSPFREPSELRRQPVAAVHPRAFGGYLILQPRLAAHSVAATDFDLRFLGYPLDALLYQLRDGNVAAAIVPVCLLESMAAEGLVTPSRFRVLMPAPPLGGCVSSTPGYPNWSFGALPHVSEALAADVARVLLEPREGAAGRWGAPISSAQVETLFHDLDVHPFQQGLWESLQALLRRYWHYAALAAALLALGLAYHLWVQRQALRRGRQLRDAQLRLRQREWELAAAQRVTLLGEMASSLAHELNQPLAAIRHYAEGCSVRLERERADHPLLPILQRIDAEAARGAAVVEQARQWLRREPPTLTDIGIDDLLADTHRLLEYALDQHGVQLRWEVERPGMRARGDRLALEQVLNNLIRNSIQAYQAQGRAGGIDIRVRDEDGRILILLEDGAGGFSAERLREPFVPFRSARETGLGLGLVICQRLMRRQHGDIHLANTARGARIRLTLPRGGG